MVALKNEIKFYDKFYAKGGWESGYNYDRVRNELVNLIIKPTKWKKEDRLLEIACGMGFHTNVLYSLGYNITGLDISSVGIEEARASSTGAQFLCENTAHFIPSAPYTGILCRGHSWYHYNLDETALNNTRRIFEWLEPNGIFVLQIATDFSGTRPKGKIHNNTVEQYLSLFEKVGTVTFITDWKGNKLRKGDTGQRGVIVVVKKNKDGNRVK